MSSSNGRGFYSLPNSPFAETYPDDDANASNNPPSSPSLLHSTTTSAPIHPAATTTNQTSTQTFTSAAAMPTAAQLFAATMPPHYHEHGTLFTLRGYAYWRKPRSGHSNARCLDASASQFINTDVVKAMIKCERTEHILFATSPTAGRLVTSLELVRNGKRNVNAVTNATQMVDLSPETDRVLKDKDAEDVWSKMLGECRGEWGYQRVTVVEGWEFREFAKKGKNCPIREGWMPLQLKQWDDEVDEDDEEEEESDGELGTYRFDTGGLEELEGETMVEGEEEKAAESGEEGGEEEKDEYVVEPIQD
ncbi:uncharacterized protein BDZ99DRAFT_514197 [Mytilinidion resinicola]|uniref:Uncharacterized protein n=1 Tax=Mytilinidion resinicola TaxID=574789 RepID=A0A6A6ZAD0_9PEZI|nr:uncharacterized protein BDZ99DRAFT_514197 [Mytilinidion resinicola]KAF2817976.1 hypothetical protein BDZ99DRAFT_514197 [Mytilinidion resinicola]